MPVSGSSLGGVRNYLGSGSNISVFGSATLVSTDCSLYPQGGASVSKRAAHPHVCPHQTAISGGATAAGIAGRARVSPFPMISVQASSGRLSLVENIGSSDKISKLNFKPIFLKLFLPFFYLNILSVLLLRFKRSFISL